MRIVFFWFLLISLTPVFSDEIEETLTRIRAAIGETKKTITSLEALRPRSEDDEQRLKAAQVELVLLQEQEVRMQAEAKELDRLYDETIGVSNICPLHKVKMKQVRVKVRYGLLLYGPGDPLPETRQSLFPHAGTFYSGGCSRGSWSRDTATVYQCGKCRKTEEEWVKKNSKK